MTHARTRPHAGLLATALALAVIALVPVAPHAQMKPDVALKAAIDKEVVDGDLKTAIEMYRPLAEQKADRSVAAKALMRMGQCYEKLGTAQTAESRKAYERLVRDFADQKDVAEQARARLAALTPAAAPAPTSAPGSLRLVYQGGGRTAAETISLSAGARCVLFSQYQGTEFMVRDLTTGRDTRVPHPSAEALAAEWRGAATETATGLLMKAVLSPDCGQILYGVFVRLGPASKAGRTQSQIRLVNSDGTGSRLVAKTDGVWMTLFRSAADGKSVLVMLQTRGEQNYSIASVRLSDGSLTRLGEPVPAADGDFDYMLSPDGRFVAIYEELDTGKAISIADSRTGKRSRIAGPVKAKIFWLVGWAPDGSGLVLKTDQSGSPSAWFVRLADGVSQGQPELLRANIGDDNSLGIGSDGSYYYAKRIQIANRYVAALDPRTGKVVGTPTSMPDLQVSCGYAWSPDGTAIASGAKLNQGTGDPAAPCTLVAIRSRVDGRVRVLSPGLTDIQRPRWSPDGKDLVVFGHKGAISGDFRVGLDSNLAELLVERPVSQGYGNVIMTADWTPDGKGLILGRLDSKGDGRLSTHIVHHDLKTGTETDRYVIDGPRYLKLATTSVSRDGRVCALIVDPDGSCAAVVVPPDDSPARVVYRVPANLAFSGVTWSADGKAIYVPQRQPGAAGGNTRKLMLVPIDGGEPVDAGLSHAGLDNVMPSPDGKQLLFSAFEDQVEIWAIDRLVPTKTAASAVTPKK